MTTEELRNEMNRNFRVNQSWPKEYAVDAETYANVCQFIFEVKTRDPDGFILIAIGEKRGIMFKNVELILKKND